MKLFEKAVFVIGPTASGKTALAHAIADSLIAQGKGCELVPIVAGEPRPIRKCHVTILCPSVPCSFVIVPDSLADASLMKGRLS